MYYTPEQLDDMRRQWSENLARRELITEQLAEILADNAHRLRVWSPPSLDGVASVSINGDAVQLNIETGTDDA